MARRGRGGRYLSIPFGIALSLAACNHRSQPAPTPRATSTAPATAAARPSGAPGPSAAASAAPASDPLACGGLGCRLYDTPAKAFAAVLEKKPLVLAVGETHAQRGSEGIESATRRFTRQLLPELKGRASDLVLELWLGNSRCQKQVKKVAKQQKKVTKHQAKTDQNEFVTLGNTAKALGIQPHVLRPSCKEYDRILKAGPGDVEQMLEMIARLTGDQLIGLVEQNKKRAPDADLVLAYGGAMHNDLFPREDREKWSFGARVSKATGQRYAALDLIVPEFVKDTAAWRSLPWYPYYRRGQYPGKTLLFRPGKGSWVLVFPEQSAAGAASDAGRE